MTSPARDERRWRITFSSEHRKQEISGPFAWDEAVISVAAHEAALAAARQVDEAMVSRVLRSLQPHVWPCAAAGVHRRRSPRCLDRQERHAMKLAAQFWSKVAIKEADECWEWTAYRHQNNYGRVWFQGCEQGAHRVAWKLKNGPIPDGLVICHRCDNPGCVNPNHLFLGTHSDNMRDKVAKGRHDTRGERNANALVTEDQVREIKSILAAGQLSHREIGALFGISRASVGDIHCGRKWKHLTVPEPEEADRG